MDRSLLLVLPVPMRVVGRGGERRFFVESQAHNGLDRWAENFSRVVYAGPSRTLDEGEPADPGIVWRDAAALEHRDRIELVPLPTAYGWGAFLRRYRPVRRELGALIARCRYLSFAIGGFVGDWGGVAAWEAHRQGRPYSVWTDRVEHEVVRESLGGASLARRLKAELVTIPLMKWHDAQVIRRAALGLFHGRDCYDAYAALASHPELVHDVHTRASDRISEPRLADKIARVRGGGPLRIAYAGRAEAMKGPEDWLEAIHRAIRAGADLQATWYGEGSQLAALRGEVEARGLAERVHLPGFLADRAAILAALQDADLFVFCHKTPESPRCLIEALICGCPIAGYESPYPRDLTASGGGLLTPAHDVGALADAIVAVDRDRERLAALIRQAADVGSHFDDREVFRHRSELIQRHLP